MLTIFAIPKPFEGHIAVIQRNAIRSWALLRPACETILFGDDKGTAEAAAEFGVRHVRNVARNEHGTPLVSDLFAKAERLAGNGLLCFVNSDIILTGEFTRAVEYVARRRRRFLMVGQRWDVDLEEPWDFGRSDWDSTLREYVREHGRPHPRWGMDYFVFRRGLFGPIPPFAVGIPGYDNWLLFRARRRLAAVVDATPVFMAVHQNHDFGRFVTRKARRSSPQGQHNINLMGAGFFNLDDATHVLLPRGLRLAWRPADILRHLRRLSVLFPRLCVPLRAIFRLLDVAGRLWSALGAGRRASAENASQAGEPEREQRLNGAGTRARTGTRA